MSLAIIGFGSKHTCGSILDPTVDTRLFSGYSSFRHILGSNTDLAD
jgi:hypothetical protein